MNKSANVNMIDLIGVKRHEIGVSQASLKCTHRTKVLNNKKNRAPSLLGQLGIEETQRQENIACIASSSPTNASFYHRHRHQHYHPHHHHHHHHRQLHQTGDRKNQDSQLLSKSITSSRMGLTFMENKNIMNSRYNMKKEEKDEFIRELSGFSLVNLWPKHLQSTIVGMKTNWNFQQCPILLALVLLLLLSNCLALLKLSGSIEPAEASVKMVNFANHDDEAADFSANTQLPPVADDANTSSDSDNLTQIPFEYNNNSNNNNKLATPLSTTTWRPALTARRASNLRVTESELLPFADFNVQQPAFSDLMKSWPPTTLQEANSMLPHSSHLEANRRHTRQQHPIHQKQFLWTDNELDERLMLNHLNEDLDDTIVTADQSFERDQLPEPPTWINYLGELGDYIYVQLEQYLENNFLGVQEMSKTSEEKDSNGEQQNSSLDNNGQDNSSFLQQQQLKMETIDELLDDYYYDQYENSQVLYYGAQLVREGDIFEIGCYMPHDQPAEWTKSGRPLASNTSSPRVIRRNNFLGAKQNFSIKIFEASLNDSGNYRCNKMSRKYHKLVVVPLTTTTTQLYVIQQRLLSVVNPQLMSVSLGGSPLNRFTNLQQVHRILSTSKQSNQSKRDYLVPGYLIVEQQQLIVNCNITDEFVLRRLRENPQFQLAWFKNGKQLRNQLASAHFTSNGISSTNQSPIGTHQSTTTITKAESQPVSLRARQQSSAMGVAMQSTRLSSSSQRIQFLQANGRQLYITSALYSDAGDYLCSWSKLPTRQQQQQQPADFENENEFYSTGDQGQRQTLGATFASNPLAAGSLVQLMAPVKLRPFKSTYHVRQGNELRLICQAQRGYPPAYISWYVGNRLVDSEFLKEHADEYRILHLKNQNQAIVTSTTSPDSQAAAVTAATAASYSSTPSDRGKIVEINPIPTSRQQMQMTANRRGQWIEYRDMNNEKYAIETPEQQLGYLQQKLVQLMGLNAATTQMAQSASGSSASSSIDPMISLLSQSSVSVLVVNSLSIERHTSRYACRATTRANTDEVTTVIRVQASSTIPVRPSSGRATLIPGQDLHFQCEKVGHKEAEFWWFHRALNGGSERLLQPNNDETIEIHNDKLTLHKTDMKMVGDYTCRPLKGEGLIDSTESATIKVRSQPYIEDFSLDTSHTGKSSVITDGDRLELTCTVRDSSAPVNITWLRSERPDDERTMVLIPETSPESLRFSSQAVNDPFASTFNVPDQNIIIERLSTHSKRLVIESVKHEHRSFYACIADNGITERTRKIIFIRVKDKLVALWPFLGIVAELFILFTIIHIWETQRAYKELSVAPPIAIGGTTAPTGSKRPASGASVPFESEPLTSG